MKERTHWDVAGLFTSTVVLWVSGWNLALGAVTLMLGAAINTIRIENQPLNSEAKR